MDTNMEDVGRAPADVSPVQNEPASIPTLDGWIESLMNCKQLAEADVQRLCDKVSIPPSCNCIELRGGGLPPGRHDCRLVALAWAGFTVRLCPRRAPFSASSTARVIE